jgi:hypothetical protein
MEEQNKSMLSPLLTHSLIISGVMIVHAVVVDVAGIYYSTYNQIAGLVLITLGLFYAVFSYRKEYLNNYISMGKAFGYAMLVTLIVAVITNLFNHIHVTWITPDLTEQGIAIQQEKMLARGVSEDRIEAITEQQQRFNTFGWKMLFGVGFFVILGAIISLIVSAILKREPKNPFEGVE